MDNSWHSTACSVVTFQFGKGPTLMDVDTFYRNPVPLLYQSGYLTIKGYASRFTINSGHVRKRAIVRFFYYICIRLP